MAGPKAYKINYTYYKAPLALYLIVFILKREFLFFLNDLC